MGRAEEALSFASATLAEAGANDRTALTELERSLALLAFPDPHASPFADLLLPAHSQKVSNTETIQIFDLLFRFIEIWFQWKLSKNYKTNNKL